MQPETGASAPPLSASVIAAWAEAAAPPPALSVSEWADARRFLPESSGVAGAKWETATAPYLAGIMDAVLEPDVTRVVVRKCSQTGGSEALHNIIGYFMEHDPCAILFVHPTAAVGEEWSKDRLANMIRSTPALSRVVYEAESTLNLKMFTGGSLAVGGANTPNTFARRAVRVAIGDDVDRFPAVVGEEGDPADLLANRTTTFHNPLVILVSTPTLKKGRIDTAFERSDKRHFHVTCPDCEREDYITWNDRKHFRVTWDDRDASTARIECPSEEYGGCGARMREPERRAMVHDGRWIATATAQDIGAAGFHLPAMVSTLGVTLPGLVAGWLSARERGKESLRVFINTKLAEGWEDHGARAEPQGLIGRRESYGAGVEVPARAVALTCGVDVQENRFVLQVVGWGLAGERWVVDWRTVDGNPKRGETQQELLEALARRYTHESGHLLPIHATCLDTGFATEQMYDVVLANPGRRIYATKGIGGKSGEPIVGKPNEKRYGNGARPVRLYPINVDDAKGDVMASLALAAAGPGYMHFPLRDGVDEEYFAQLCAEHRETRYNRAGVAVNTVWVQDRERNEALDTAVLALAALRILNPNLLQFATTLASTPLPPTLDPGPGSAPAPAASSPRPPRARFARSSYLGRG